jgi:hypothetical protein
MGHRDADKGVSMKITNHTRWRTADIRALAERVAAEELNPGQAQHLHIEVFTRGAAGGNKDRYTSVRLQGDRAGARAAGLTYNFFTLKLPVVRPAVLRLPPERRQVFLANRWVVARAYTGVQLAHEMAECRGKKHADMRGCTRYGYRPRGGSYGAYWQQAFKDMPLRWDPPAPVVRIAPTPLEKAAKQRARAQARVAQAEAKVAEWTRKQKLATTFLKKWQRRLRAQQRARAKEAFQLVMGGVA